MTEPSEQTTEHPGAVGTLRLPETAGNPLKARREAQALVVHVALLAGAIFTAVLTSSQADWNLGWFAVLLALTLGTEILAVLLAESSVAVTGGFLGIMVAAVLLGGAPAAIVGVASIATGWLRTREPMVRLFHNLAAYAVFPLVTGIVFHGVVVATGTDSGQTAYYVLIFGAFLLGLGLNVGMVVVYVSFVEQWPLRRHIGWMKQLAAPELFAALLTLVAAYLTEHLGVAGLLMVALVITVYQYLVGQLLLSEQRAEQLKRLATTDDLTGLSNRSSFSDGLTAAIAKASEQEQGLAVMLVNLDSFRDVNDTLGHEYGDQLLTQLAPRLEEHVGENGVLSRFGGDEFALISPYRGGDPEVDRLATELRARVQEPVTIGEVTMTVNASVGIARYPEDGVDAQTLMRRADIALHEAKEHRDSHAFYDSERDHHSAQQLSLVGDFRRALESDDQIVLMYHPIVNLFQRRLNGAEALVRWQHPELGLLSPGAFLQTVEHTGLIIPLTAAVLDRAVRDCAAWNRQGQRLNVSVNLSVRNLRDPGLPNLVQETLTRHGLDPQQLKLEITESMIMSDPERSLATVNQLRELGVKLAVDDFGTGHASLANLRMLPVDELKIDRSFVTPMLHEPSDLVIVRSTIELGHALGLKVVAEGVEDEKTAEFLAAMHCDRAQGHLFSKPIPADQLQHWAETFKANAA